MQRLLPGGIGMRTTKWAAAIALALLAAGCQKSTEELRREQRTLEETAQAQRGMSDEAGRVALEQADFRATIDREIDGYRTKADALRAAETAEKRKGERTADDRLIRDADARRAALDADRQAIDGATTATWGDVKAKVDRDLDEFRKAVKAVDDHLAREPHPGGAKTTTNPSTPSGGGEKSAAPSKPHTGPAGPGPMAPPILP